MLIFKFILNLFLFNQFIYCNYSILNYLFIYFAKRLIGGLKSDLLNFYKLSFFHPKKSIIILSFLECEVAFISEAGIRCVYVAMVKALNMLSELLGIFFYRIRYEKKLIFCFFLMSPLNLSNEVYF